MKRFKEFILEEITEKSFDLDRAKEIATTLDIDLEKYNLLQFKKGLNVELEHAFGSTKSVDDLDGLSKIVIAHLKEIPDYYDRLEKMEKDAAGDFEKKDSKKSEEKPIEEVEPEQNEENKDA